MKKPMNYLPAMMMVCIVLIIMTLCVFQYTQSTQEFDYTEYIDESKINQPGPKRQMAEDLETEAQINVTEGKIVLLKEDYSQEEEELPSTHLATEIVNEVADVQITEIESKNNDVDAEEQEFMDLVTINESLMSIDGTDKYLVIAGTYTDNMVLLSKQAQYANKGYNAEIIQFEDNPAKNICMGRYTDANIAESRAEEIELKHDISTYVYHQGAGGR